MEISALSHNVRAGDLSLEQLAKNSELSESDKISELSRQFEALLLRQILQNIRKTVIKSDLLPGSATHDIYQDMATNQLAESLSQSGSFGLASSLEKELTRQLMPKAAVHQDEAKSGGGSVGGARLLTSRLARTLAPPKNQTESLP